MNDTDVMESTPKKQSGFTLIELLVTTVVSMVILGGLMYSFTSQHREYKFQDRRMNASQDLEFVIHFIADDIRSSLITNPADEAAAITAAADAAPTLSVARVNLVPAPTAKLGAITFPAAPPPAAPGGFAIAGLPTAAAGNLTDLYTTVWETDTSFWGVSPNDAVTNKFRAVRHYTLVATGTTNSLRYDRNVRDGNDNPSEILPNVTAFRIFEDVPPTLTGGWSGGVWVPGTATTCSSDVGGCDCVKPMIDGAAGTFYAAAPCGLGPKKVMTADGTEVYVPSYTILLETIIDAAYKGASPVDWTGATLTGANARNRRIWRFIQVYPGAVD